MASNTKELESHSPLETEEPLNEITSPERPVSPVSNCSICLDEFTNKCHPDSCCHLFCFECLKQWTAIKATCPLCLVDVKHIFHSFNDQGLHETYEVIGEVPLISLGIDTDVEIIEDSDSEEMASGDSGSYLSLLRQYNHRLMLRLEVYYNNIWAQPLQSAGFGEYNISYWSEDHFDEVYRLITFITREIFIVRTKVLCDTNGITNEAITYILMEKLMYVDICGHDIFDFLLPYFGPHTAHFCHEFHTFATSGLTLDDFDEFVRYPMRRSVVNVVGPRRNVSDVVDWVPLSYLFTNENHNESYSLELLFANMFETINWDYEEENSFHWLPTYEGFCNEIPCNCINQALERINVWAVQTSIWARIQNCLNLLHSTNRVSDDLSQFNVVLEAMIEEMYQRNRSLRLF